MESGQERSALERRPAELDFTDLAVGELVDQAIEPEELDGIISPLDGRIVAIDDVDELADELERLDAIDRSIYSTKIAIRQALVDLSEGTAKTRRVQGRRRIVRLEMPGDSWENSILKEAWESYPAHRDQYLRIAKVEPKLREVAKLFNTAGPADLNTFRDIVASANRGPTGIATAKIEQ